MKITEIHACTLQSPLKQPFAFCQGWVTKRSATLVEVITDEGISGWGEAFNTTLSSEPWVAKSVEKV